MNTDLKMCDVLKRLYAEYGDRAPSYQTLNRRTVEGRVPAYKLRQWHFKEADMDAIRAGLGLPPIGKKAA